MNRSLVIVKPDALNHKVDNMIVSMLMEVGRIKKLEHRWLLPSEVEALYAVHKDKPFFDSLVDHMSSGPSIVIWMEGDKDVIRQRALGIRESNPQYVQNPRNLIHATDYNDDPEAERQAVGI